VSKTVVTPVVRRGSLQVPEKRVIATAVCNQGINRVIWPDTFLRGAIAPRLLVSLDSLVPPPLANARLEMRRHLSHILTLSHHAASHLVTICIHC
jgi:hypothetical protein